MGYLGTQHDEHMAEMIARKPTTAQKVAEMLARKPTMIHVARNGVWAADLPTGSLFSYERLDYHTGCRAFLEGLRDAGIPFTFHGNVTL